MYLLLLHELGVGAVVDDILAEDGGGERVVDLLSVDVLSLPLRIKSLPLVPRQTVVFLPSRTKVKTSPYFSRQAKKKA